MRLLRQGILRTILPALLLAPCLAPALHAQGGIVQNGSGGTAPEIDPSMSGAGIALVGGVILVLRSRKR